MIVDRGHSYKGNKSLSKEIQNKDGDEINFVVRKHNKVILAVW